MTYIQSGLQQTFEHKDFLHRITNRIKRSLELQEILAATVTELREFLGTDRVKVYRFDLDGNGEVIAESIYNQRLPSLLGLHFPADDIPEKSRQMYLLARQRTIVDVSSGRIGLSRLQCPETGKPLNEIDNFQYRRVDPCHLEYLKAMGVQSSLVVPIVDCDHKEESAKPRLWGLLVSHHSQPRTFLKREIRMVQQVADQLSLAIAVNNLLAQNRAEQKRGAIINRISILLNTVPEIQLSAALKETITALGGVGGRLHIQPTSQLYTWGDQPILPGESENNLLEKHSAWQNWITQCKHGNVLAIQDLYKQPQFEAIAPFFQSTRIRGILVIPLHYRQKCIGSLSIFRHEFDTEILWAGCGEENQRQRLPQFSFAAWREQKKEQALEWKPEETSLAEGLYHHFSIAIQQQLIYQKVKKMRLQVQRLNLNLKRKVQQQTAQLQKSLQYSVLLKQITDQIHSTLDLKSTLQTIVREIRKLLNTDRVLIYQFLENTEGEVIFEEVNGNWKSVLGMKAPSECFPDEYTHLYFRGRVRAINNTLATSLSPCHQEFLHNLQVQACLIVPIKMGAQLWGLLIAHNCHAPRNWHDDEIDLLQQLADQAAIAIQQAQLYEQSLATEAEATAKAAQLEQALCQLQQTQTQLIQTEKMSSLGQLVAGIAHEINNPVNFIYGNLSHVINYTQELLALLQLYQIHNPQPNEEVEAKADAIDLEFVVDDLPKILSSMQAGAERIQAIVLSLRNFSRLDQAEIKPVDLHEGIDNTLLILQHRLKPTAKFPGIKVIKDYGNLPLVECYAGEINQVFMNIIANAIDVLIDIRNSNTSYIRISTEVSTDKSRAVVCIADNGQGMSEEVKKRIFDPFFTTKPVGKGMGLGLAISYQTVVNKHGGKIECVSEIEKGTEFRLEIPLKQTVQSISEY
ncbi:MAG: GAF domain-containing protein [Chlorogloeopsis fritschii C42_A2020_084]|uniref:GAF domain-containing protein n=1 Tax=Chlorogloeopsis fritschii TaxID=1124 RepID=UPI0019E28CEA|nr:GAF domain-containing protein [Chlorogloeopsis fritschii]MBF2008981.1 GAF domain-containing protein [Chlorogloeopsis fritschii C42_A2020_084]